MNQTIYFFIILAVKLFFIIGFISTVKYWQSENKKKSRVPMVIYWILGLYFSGVLSSQIFEAAILGIFKILNLDSINLQSITSISSVLGLVFYILIGALYLNKLKAKNESE